MTSQTPALQRFSPVERQQAILTAAREVFIETGLGGARTKLIAERAGVAEGTIFKYFKNKDALFERAVVEVLEQLVKRLESAAAEYAVASGGHDRIEQARLFHIETAQAMSEIAPLLGAVMSADTPAGELSYYERLVEPSIVRIAEAFTVSLEAVNQQVDPRLFALVFFGSHFFIALDTRFRADPIAVSEQLLELLTHGFGRRPAPGDD